MSGGSAITLALSLCVAASSKDGGGLGGLGVGGGGAGGLGSGGLSFMTASRLQIHPPHEIVEARVVADGVESRVCLSQSSTVIAFINGFGQPFDG